MTADILIENRQMIENLKTSENQNLNNSTNTDRMQIENDIHNESHQCLRQAGIWQLSREKIFRKLVQNDFVTPKRVFGNDLKLDKLASQKTSIDEDSKTQNPASKNLIDLDINTSKSLNNQNNGFKVSLQENLKDGIMMQVRKQLLQEKWRKTKISTKKEIEEQSRIHHHQNLSVSYSKINNFSNNSYANSPSITFTNNQSGSDINSFTSNQTNINNSQKKIHQITESKLLSGRILYRIKIFESQMNKEFDQNQKNQFYNYLSQICEWIQLNEDKLKGFYAESIAQVMLFLVCSKIGVSKKTFIENLKPNVKSKRDLPKIENIKKLNCYSMMKKVFQQIAFNN